MRGLKTTYDECNYGTGLRTKDETSETIVRNLLSLFSCIQGFKTCFFSVLDNLVNHQNTQLNAETKNQSSNRHIFGVMSR